MTREPTQPVEYWRFNIYHRFVHLLVLLSFFGSTISGLPLKYPGTAWAQWLTRLQGGVAVMGIDPGRPGHLAQLPLLPGPGQPPLLRPLCLL
jgi:hypothetical protein